MSRLLTGKNKSETAGQKQSWECMLSGRDFILKFISVSIATDHVFLTQLSLQFVKIQVQFEQQVAAIWFLVLPHKLTGESSTFPQKSVQNQLLKNKIFREKELLRLQIITVGQHFFAESQEHFNSKAPIQ